MPATVRVATATGKPTVLEHFSLDGYPFGRHRAETIGQEIRDVLGAKGCAGDDASRSERMRSTGRIPVGTCLATLTMTTTITSKAGGCDPR